MKTATYAKQLVAYARRYLLLDPADETYCLNKLLFLLGEEDPGVELPDSVEGMTGPDAILQPLCDAAVADGIIDDSQRTSFAERLMDTVSLSPSRVRDEFDRLRDHDGVRAATEWFHDYCEKTDYVKRSAIEKNLRWDAPGKKGGLVITVNLSKPEIDNKKSAAALKKKASGYPLCTICRTNVGYDGHGTVRESLRTIDVTLDGHPFFWQYSPFAYFDQHAIVINTEHTPMAVNPETVRRLTDFVDQYPHYFVGSNAALPRIGGSLLVHDHFQGGLERMPMHRAEYRTVLSKDGAVVRYGILDWYNSAMRFESSDKDALVDAVGKVIDGWKGYSAPDLEIIAYTGEESHNSCAPVVRKTENGYIVDLILRNNRVDERYPDGIFHAHSEYHNIKKESIGLIEAMGLFILPARLNRQLFGEAAGYLCGKPYCGEDLAEDMQVYRPMIELLLDRYGNSLSAEEAAEAILLRINEVCEAILVQTAVFPETAEGQKRFTDFVAAQLG